MEIVNASKGLIRYANAVARRNGHGRADNIFVGEDDKVLAHVPYGYRKNTTGQYVTNSYVRKGWSSVFYQHAETTVQVCKDVYNEIMKKENCRLIIE